MIFAGQKSWLGQSFPSQLADPYGIMSANRDSNDGGVGNKLGVHDASSMPAHISCTADRRYHSTVDSIRIRNRENNSRLRPKRRPQSAA